MIRRFPLILLVLAVGGGAGYLVSSGGCGKPEPEQIQSVKVARPAKGTNDVKLDQENVAVPKDKDPVETALIELLKPGEGGQPSALPKGTKLLSVKVANGLATIDFSEEFAAVQNSGTTGESLAQNALRKTLAQFPNIDKMLVHVNGKPVESEHTDWSQPIPVRDTRTAASNP